MPALVSVIIPAYNHEKYVQETIKSIINQIYQNIELIIIDDGSKDNTYAKILEMEHLCKNRFSRVVFDTQENIGAAFTTNKLFDLVQGDYVYFIASDDLAKPQAIEKQVEFLETDANYGLVVGDNEIIDSESKVCYWKDDDRNIVYNSKQAKYKTFVDYLKVKKKYFDNKEFGTYPTLYVGNYIPNGYLVRNEILQKIEKYPVKDILEDWFLMLQLAKYTKFKFFNEILFSYRWHQHNTIKNKKLISSYIYNVKVYEDKILDKLETNSNNPLSPDLLKITKYGYLYKRQGIPFIGELFTYSKQRKKLKIFKIFNIKIFEFYK